MKIGSVRSDESEISIKSCDLKNEKAEPEWLHDAVKLNGAIPFDGKFQFPQLFMDSALAACFECGGKCGNACGCDAKCTCDGGNCGCDGGKG